MRKTYNPHIPINMIALTTPTGNIGSKVLRLLAQSEGQPLRILARDPEKIPAEFRERVEIIQGSMEDAESLGKLLAGADALFWCQPDPASAVDYYGAYESMARAGAAAIQATAVPRVVAISAAGEPGSIPAGPITGLHRMESILSGTGASIRALRCGSFCENLHWQWDQIMGDGTFTYAAPGDVPGPQVTTQDIARVAAKLLADRTWNGYEAIPLLGPVDLSYDDMASALSEALGKRVLYQPTDPTEYAAGLQAFGHSPAAAQGLVDMFTYLAGIYAPAPEAQRDLTPTTLEQWLRQQE